jgi:hypothetical protein
MRGLTGRQRSVWDYLVQYRIYATGKVQARQSDIAKELGTTQQVVASALSALGKRDLVRKVFSGLYVINPVAVYRGNDDALEKLSGIFFSAERIGHGKRRPRGNGECAGIDHPQDADGEASSV